MDNSQSTTGVQLPPQTQMEQAEVPQDLKYPKPPKQSKHIFKNILLILIILILLAGVLGGGYFIATQISQSLKSKAQATTQEVIEEKTPTIVSSQNPTDLQTYNGPEKFTTTGSPYSFKYPPNWQYEPSLRYVQSDYIEDVIANATSDLSKRYVLTVDTVSNKNASNLQDFISGHQTPGTYPNLALNTYAKDTSINIAGTEWMIDRNASGAGGNESAIFMKGTTVVLLTCSNCTNEITNQIISSFKFSQ